MNLIELNRALAMCKGLASYYGPVLAKGYEYVAYHWT
jgi:hypothetical protein